ncbi:MAG: indoleacetamide hydrolase [Steroidobacteraceae bacterium]
MKLEELKLIEAADAIRCGEVSAEVYAEALLQRCAAAKGLNALIVQDAVTARAAARRAEMRRGSGQVFGPLHGVPLVIKDNLDTVGLPTTGGTQALRNNRPARNAPVVQRLLDAGAIVFGKANMHELAFGITNNNAAFGPVRNPYDPTRISGGSSGGTAVAVAARLAPGGIGTDTGGSVRIPAALCGIVGFRPTTGRWPQGGIVPVSHTRDTAGPMTRSVADATLLDAVVTGECTASARVELAGLRLGVPRAHFYDNLDPTVASVMTDVLGRLNAVGVVLVEAEIPDLGVLAAAASFPIALYETVSDLNLYLRDHRTARDFAAVVAEVVSPDVKGILQGLLGPDAVPEAVYRDALTQHRPALQDSYRSYFADHHVAAVIFPTTPLPAARIGEDETCVLNGKPVPTFATFARNTDPGSVAGIPGISLPAGQSREGLPVGLELDGPAGSDRLLLAVAAAIEPLLPQIAPPMI